MRVSGWKDGTSSLHSLMWAMPEHYTVPKWAVLEQEHSEAWPARAGKSCHGENMTEKLKRKNFLLFGFFIVVNLVRMTLVTFSPNSKTYIYIYMKIPSLKFLLPCVGYFSGI